MRRMQTIFGSIVLAACVVAAQSAQAAFVARAELGDAPAFAGARTTRGATTDLYAYSLELTLNPPMLLQNDSHSVSLISNGAVVANPPMERSAPTSQIIFRRKNRTQVSYGPPIIRLANQDKTLIKQLGDIETLTSESGLYTGSAAQGNTNPFIAGNRLMAEASGLPSPVIAFGSAAGEAIDPFTVPGGSSYAYAPTIDATLQLPDSSVFAGVEFYALDSFVFTSDEVGNFIEDGSPFADTLWMLSLAASGILPSSAGVEIDFELNPVALSELVFSSSYLSGLPGYSSGLAATAIALLIDNEIERRIQQMLTFNDHSVTLQNFALFPADTLFRPVGGDVVFADGVAAVVSSVPEPASLWLLGAGLIGLAGMRLRRASDGLLNGE